MIKDGANQLQQNVDKDPALSQYGQTREGIVSQRKKEIEDRINQEREDERKEHVENVKKSAIAQKKREREIKRIKIVEPVDNDALDLDSFLDPLKHASIPQPV